MTFKWTIRDDEFLIYDGLVFKTVSANSIFSIFKESESSDIYPSISQIVDMPKSFSSIPLEIKLELINTQGIFGQKFELKAFAFSKKVKIPIADLLTRNSDHIIFDNVWYPFVPGNIEALKKSLNEIQIHSLDNLTLRQVINLKKLAISSDSFFDKISLEGTSSYVPSIDFEDDINVKAKLYPYQVRGYNWLKFITSENLGAILADEMGLGKTLQVISLLSSKKIKNLTPALIVGPSTLLENWRREIAKFSPSLSAIVHSGPLRTGLVKDILNYNVVIASYDTVVRDFSLFNQVSWEIVILDEAQAIKNPEAKRTKTIKKLPRRVSFAVTGTPVENELLDLWSLFDFALNGYLGNQEDFKRNFEESSDGALKLEPYVRPLLLRRTVLDVAKDLPEKIEIPQILVMSKAEADEYENIREEALRTSSGSASLSTLIKLRQFSTHPFVVNGQSLDPLKHSSKYKRLIEILDEIFLNRQKVIIFTSFHKMADIFLEDLVLRYKVYGNFIDGRTEITNRQVIVDEFSSVVGSAFLILNPKAAGTGLNITAANHVIHYNLEWNPAVEDQASARAHRRGQELPVTIHRLFYSNTVEEVINERLKRKRKLAGSVVVGVMGNSDDFNDIAAALSISPITGNEE